MPSLKEFHKDNFVKLIYIGDSGSGKTGSLAPLVGEGYKLRIVDTDRGVETLFHYVQRDYPDKLDLVEYEPVRDSYKLTKNGPVIAGRPRAWGKGLELMTTWPDGTSPSEWGDDHILVVDSLSTYARAAFEFAKFTSPNARDPRQWYFAAQQQLESFLAAITSDDFKTNVILISHINFTERADGIVKGYPNSIGQALGPVIGRYFNTFILAESSGAGKGAKRQIMTTQTGVIDLKNPAPFKIEDKLPLESGMAKIFKQLKEIQNGS